MHRQSRTLMRVLAIGRADRACWRGGILDQRAQASNQMESMQAVGHARGIPSNCQPQSSRRFAQRHVLGNMPGIAAAQYFQSQRREYTWPRSPGHRSSNCAGRPARIACITEMDSRRRSVPVKGLAVSGSHVALGQMTSRPHRANQCAGPSSSTDKDIETDGVVTCRCSRSPGGEAGFIG